MTRPAILADFDAWFRKSRKQHDLPTHQVKNGSPSSDRKWQKEFMGNPGIEIPTAESIVAQMREEWDSFLADWTAGNKGF